MDAIHEIGCRCDECNWVSMGRRAAILAAMLVIGLVIVATVFVALVVVIMFLRVVGMVNASLMWVLVVAVVAGCLFVVYQSSKG